MTRTAYLKLYQNGPPVAYRLTNGKIDVITRLVFCCEECRGQYIDANPGSWSRGNYRPLGRPCCDQCDKPIWD